MIQEAATFLSQDFFCILEPKGKQLEFELELKIHDEVGLKRFKTVRLF